MLKELFPQVYLIKNIANVGFGRANNQMSDCIAGRYALLLNSDASVASYTIQKTFDFIEDNPKTDILGVRHVGRDQVLHPSCRNFPAPWNLFLVRSGLYKFFSSSHLVDNIQWDCASVSSYD